jgi:uracil-DNA glycosylase family 4
LSDPRHCLKPCPGCPFHGPRVGGKGDPNSPIVVIGESPGMQELKQKLPFVGPSGFVLDKSLKVTEHVEPYFINALQCFPGMAADKDQAKVAAAVSQCRQRVLDEIAQAPRDIILALGAPALWAVTGNYDYKITFERGKLFPTELAKIGCVPTVHPAFLMRGGAGATYQQYLRDVKYALDLHAGKPAKRPPEVQYLLARDERDIKDIAKYFRTLPAGTPIGADIETSGFSFLSDRILCAGFAAEPDEVFVIPEELVPAISDDLFDNDCHFTWHNGKFDVKFLWQADVKRARIDEDTMLMSYVLDENGGIHDLETVSSDWLGSPNWKNVLDSYLPKPGLSYDIIPREVLYHYMALDIGNTRGLIDILRPTINADPALKRAYERTLIPAANFLAKVETRGIYVDLERVKDNKEWYGEKIEGYRNQFNAIAANYPDSGYTEKLMGSWQQMQRLLYDDLKIKPHRNKRGTGKDLVEKLVLVTAEQKAAVKILQESRKVNKEYGTYVKNVLDNIDLDGAVHTTYLQHGTRTGRLASRDPNLQNVPRNPRIRGQYVARPGRRFLEPDLNQAELRALACFSRDPALCYIYENAGMSLHDELRADIWGYPKDWSSQDVDRFLVKFGLRPEERFGEKGEDRIVEEQKMRAKAVNFGIVYGREAFSIAEEFQIDPKEAQIWINAWFKKFPAAKDFLESCRAVPEKGQVIVNNFGFKRRFGVVGYERLKGMQNEASNFPPQSCASHITLHSGIELADRLADEFDTYPCNLVHDSILLDCPDDDHIVAQVGRIVIDKMEEVPRKWGFTRIPFVAEAKMGYRWGELQKYKPPKLLEVA